MSHITGDSLLNYVFNFFLMSFEIFELYSIFYKYCNSLYLVFYSIFLILGLKKVFKKVKPIEIISIRTVFYLYNSSILHEKFSLYFATWLNKQHLSNLIRPISYSNCKLCKKTIVNCRKLKIQRYNYKLYLWNSIL